MNTSENSPLMPQNLGNYNMIVSTIQAILIAAVTGLIVGGVIGWKLTFNLRLAKIQEQQVTINRLREENSKLKAEVRGFKSAQRREKVGNAASAAGETVTTVANNIKSKFFGQRKSKPKVLQESKEDKENS